MIQEIYPTRERLLSEVKLLGSLLHMYRLKRACDGLNGRPLDTGLHLVMDAVITKLDNPWITVLRFHEKSSTDIARIHNHYQGLLALLELTEIVNEGDALAVAQMLTTGPGQPKHKIGDLVCYRHSNSYGFGTVTQRRITSKSEDKHHIEYKVKWTEGRWDKWLEEWLLLTPEEKGRPRPVAEKLEAK